MKAVASSNLDKVIFVLNEAVRHQQLLNDGVRPKRADLFCDIPHPSGQGSLPIGREAYSMLGSLAEAAAQKGNIVERADPATLRHELTERLTRMFLVGSLEPTAKSVARLLKETHVAVSGRFTCRTHFIPCHLSSSPENDFLDLGPVSFVSRERARRLLAPALHLLRRTTDREDYVHDRKMLLQAFRYYRGYRWIAVVRVEHSNGKRSEELALRAAISAMDCLQLMIGARNSSRMKIGGIASPVDRTASLGIGSDGALDFGNTVTWLGEGGLPEGWVSQLKQDYPDGLSQIATVLELAVCPDLERPLSRRFLDAAQWFGEAVRDRSASTRIIKFVFALERLVLSGEAYSLTEHVSSRVAALCIALDPAKSFDDLQSEFKRLYDVRSKLVHGEISPLDRRIAAALGSAAQFTEDAMLRCLHLWKEGEFRAKIPSTAIKRWYVDIVDAARNHAPSAAPAVQGSED